MITDGNKLERIYITTMTTTSYNSNHLYFIYIWPNNSSNYSYLPNSIFSPSGTALLIV